MLLIKAFQRYADRIWYVVAQPNNYLAGKLSQQFEILLIKKKKKAHQGRISKCKCEEQ